MQRRTGAAVVLTAGVLMTAAACGGTSTATKSPTSPTSSPPQTATTTVPTSAAPTRSTATTPPSTAAPTVPGPAGGPVPAGFQPISVTFVSADEGFVLGTTATCASAPCTSIVRTTDGGRTWVGIPAPRDTISNSMEGGVQSLTFADPLDGFAVGSDIWVTHNGGSSWAQLKTIDGLPIVEGGSALATDGVVFIAALGPNEQSVLLRGSAAGNAFTPVAGTTGDGGALVAAGGDALSTDEADRTTTVIAATGAIVRTVTDPGAGDCTLAASSSLAYLAVCSAGPSAATTVYGTTDGGVAWTRLPTPAAVGADGVSQVAVTTDLHAVMAISTATEGILIGTTDGGEQWSTVLTLGAGTGYTGLGFTNTEQGIVIATRGVDTESGTSETPLDNQLYLTRNGGEAWASVPF